MSEYFCQWCYERGLRYRDGDFPWPHAKDCPHNPLNAMKNDAHIILDNELRRDIDGIIDRLKVSSGERNSPPIPVESQRRSRERSLAITKLQEAVMWLGMDLKAINDENQSETTRQSEEIENLAMEIYGKMQRDDPEGQKYPWVIGGNSLKQQEARSAAHQQLGLVGAENPYPNSKDPSNTTIDPTADGLKL